MALAAYRDVLRSARIAFKGDVRVFQAAQQQIRDQFRANQNLEPDDASVRKGIEHAAQVARFLRENVVQGTKVDGEDAKYKLRIHEHTERGENESIKAGAGIGAGIVGGCCSNK